MYDSIAPQNRASIGLRSLLFALLVVIVFVLSSRPVSAYSGPLMVSGEVCVGDTGHPVEDADVVMEVLDASNNVLDTQYYTTEADGLYGYFWSAAPVGSEKVRVTATHPLGPQEQEVADIPGDGDVYLDIVFPYGIPQIVGPVGMSVAMVAVGAVALLFVRKKRLQ